MTPADLRKQAEWPRDYEEDTQALRAAADRIEQLEAQVQGRVAMATFLRLHEITGGVQDTPRLVNMDHVRHTYAFPGPPAYVQLNMTDGKAICVRETQDDIATMLAVHRK